MPERVRLETILADVAALRDRGEAVDATAILAAHPDLGEPLRDALAALELLDLSLVGESTTGPHVPEVVGPYRVTSRLGTGGMGTVYLAETRSAVVGCEPGERVALKVVHPHLLERPGFFKRFLREAEAGKRVDHPHVVRTLDADAVRAGGDTVHFLVMEYVEGQTLADLLEDLGVVPETLLREIARQMADGLSAIHDAGLIHRDLKPENALITSDHVVRVMDLGVARPLAAEDALTHEGQFAGSLPYAAPEQFGDGDVTASSDLYSLGVTLYELATGSSPFRRDGFAAVMAAHREHVPPSVRDIVPEVSPFFSDVVATLLAKQPERRFASAGDLASVLTESERSDWWHEREQHRPRDIALPRVPVRRETALHGRDADLALLHESWQSALAGEGRAVLLEGEAGIGKTRLVDAFLREIGESDVHVLYGSYPPTGGLGGISDAIVEHFGDHGLEDALAPYLTVTPTLVPAIAALVRHQPPPEGAAPLTPSSIQAVLVHLMRALAAEKPLVWVVDDLHFADDESRGVLLSLARAVAGHRALLLTTSRPGLPEDWLVHVGRVEEFRRHALGRLSAREVILLLQDAFKSDQLAERLGGRIALKSDGIPFFVFEMIRGLREGQFLTQMPDGTWAETKVVEQIEVPSAVRDLIEARLRDLPFERRALLEVGAVQGYAFDPGLVARVLGRPKMAVLQELADIERRSGVVHGERGSCRFDHHQLQEVLYESLPPDLRVEYHAALAEALETRTKSADKAPETLDGALCVDLCENYLRGARGESALRYLAAAQMHLSERHLPAQVVAITERALSVPELLVGSERARSLLRACAALDTMGRRARQEQCAHEAERFAEEAGDVEQCASAALALGTVFTRTSRRTEAEAAYRRALELAVACGDRRVESRATSNLGNLFHAEGRLREARERHERSLAISRESGDPVGEAGATVNLGVVFRVEGRLREAREHLERGRTLCREIGHRQFEANATGSLGNVLHAEGLLREARGCHERHLALSREIGDRLGEALAISNLGGVSNAVGRVGEARERYEQTLALCREIGHRRLEATSLGNLGRISLSEGRLRAAREHHERHLALSRAIEDRVGEAFALTNVGTVLREQGETALAEERFLASLSLSEKIGHRLGVAETHLALGAVRLAAGDAESVRLSFAVARDLAAEHGFVGVEALARCELACLPGGDAADALAALTQHDERLTADERREARWLIFRATGDPAHLEEAKRLLDEHLALNPSEYHESMCQNLRDNREIMAAWREHCGGESETRVGDVVGDDVA